MGWAGAGNYQIHFDDVDDDDDSWSAMRGARKKLKNSGKRGSEATQTKQ